MIDSLKKLVVNFQLIIERAHAHPAFLRSSCFVLMNISISNRMYLNGCLPLKTIIFVYPKLLLNLLNTTTP